MKWMRIPALAIAVTLTLLAAKPGTTAADSSHDLTFPVSVTCVSVGQLCSPTFSVVVPTAGLLEVEFIASSGHCSNIRVNIFVDSVLRSTSPFLAPGQSTGQVNLGFVGAGNHQIDVQAEGQVGGCNSGDLGAWAGTLNVDISIPTGASLVSDQQGNLFFFVFERRFVFGGGRAAAGVVAAAGQTAAKNRARAAQAAAAQAAAAQPAVTAPRTGTGITSLPSTGDGGSLRSSGIGITAVLAIGLTLLSLGVVTLAWSRGVTHRR
jgi:hypothetical protein